MNAVGDGMSDALGLDQERGHARRQGVGFRLLVGKWLQQSLG